MSLNSSVTFCYCELHHICFHLLHNDFLGRESLHVNVISVSWTLHGWCTNAMQIKTKKWFVIFFFLIWFRELSISKKFTVMYVCKSLQNIYFVLSYFPTLIWHMIFLRNKVGQDKAPSNYDLSETYLTHDFLEMEFGSLSLSPPINNW